MSDEHEKLVAVGTAVLPELFEANRERLARMLSFRLDERLRGRIDPDDILQDAYMEAARRVNEFIERPAVSFYVWLRQITYQCLIDSQRRHFGKKRDPRQEVHRAPVQDQDNTSLSILSAFFDEVTTPSQLLMRQEERDEMRAILATMDEIDREVLALRHFEHLTNNQIAEALGISVTAASNRYVRAMMRLSEIASNRRKDEES